MLVFYVETTTDAAQALLFGSFRRHQLVTEGGARLVLVEEGLFHADDLIDRDPGGLDLLNRFRSARSEYQLDV